MRNGFSIFKIAMCGNVDKILKIFKFNKVFILFQTIVKKNIYQDCTLFIWPSSNLAKKFPKKINS